jgi:hypothetical protein
MLRTLNDFISFHHAVPDCLNFERKVEAWQLSKIIQTFGLDGKYCTTTTSSKNHTAPYRSNLEEYLAIINYYRRGKYRCQALVKTSPLSSC